MHSNHRFYRRPQFFVRIKEDGGAVLMPNLRTRRHGEVSSHFALRAVNGHI